MEASIGVPASPKKVRVSPLRPSYKAMWQVECKNAAHASLAYKGLLHDLDKSQLAEIDTERALTRWMVAALIEAVLVVILAVVILAR